MATKKCRKGTAWGDWIPPTPKDDAPTPDPTQDLIDAPEPGDWTHLEPLFPMNGIPFTPNSPCPHHCKLCSGAGSLIVHGTGEVLTCPDCEGSGEGAIPSGSDFVCMTCHKAGKDGWRALPQNVEPLPLDPPKPEPKQERMTREEKQRLNEYVASTAERMGFSI